MRPITSICVAALLTLHTTQSFVPIYPVKKGREIIHASILRASTTASNTEDSDWGGWLFGSSYGGVEEAAFLKCVTVDDTSADCREEAIRIFRRWGVVRIPGVLDSTEVSELLSEGRSRGLVRNAFGQSARSDRYTQWLDADGIEHRLEYRGRGRRTKAVLEGDSNSSEYAQRPKWQRSLLDAFNPISPGTLVWPIWRQVSIVLGCPHVGLAEIVVSKPGGAAQDWHFDGTGVTLQIALTDIDEEKGPTEVLPRPLASEYVSCMMDAATTIPNRLASNAFHRPRYDLTTIGLVAIWSALRPMLDVGRARFLIERIGLPPPVVRLLASQGVATLYDSAMVHRGGLNNGLDDRPILAVHMRNDMHFGPANVTDEAR